VKKIQKAAVTNTLLFYGVVATSLFLPVNHLLRGNLHSVFNYDQLGHNEEIYRNDVRFLKSIPGSALFENPLLGFDAGKEFLFDPFNGTQMMVAGRIAEQLLVARIREKYFGVIALVGDFEGKLSELDKMPSELEGPKATLSDRWTDTTLLAIKENYERIDTGCPGEFFFYVPRYTTAPTVGHLGQHEAPSDPVETAIAEIWTNLISPARPIGRNDRFFEMGGHS
jgi:hypothetical protein